MSQELRNYTPSWREKIAYLLAGGAERLGADVNTQRAIVGKAKEAVDFVPGIGDAIGFNEAGRDIQAGNYGAGAAGLGLAALGLIPGAGDMASKVGKKALANAPEGIRAFHGSPHSFDKFSLDKIGTGEGAQAYGHGLYFADNESVALSYRDALKLNGYSSSGETDVLKAAGLTDSDLRQLDPFLATGGDPETIVRDFTNWTGKKPTPELKRAITQISEQRPKGSMYEVNIRANPDDFLDWDKPLSEQPAILDRLGYTKAKYPEDIVPDTSWTGSKFWAETQGAPNQRTDFLKSGFGPFKTKDGTHEKSAGIPGIKYLDAGSRGAGDGSRNYVVFDEKLIDIVRKYGIAGASAMLGYNVLGGMNEAQAGEISAADSQFKGGGNMIEVELPDGTIAEFPEGTAPDVIKGALQKRFAAPAAQSPEMQQANAELSALTQAANPAVGDRMAFDALPAWKKPLVAATDMAQLAATGGSIGFVNKAAAGVRAPFTDKTYEEELDALKQSDQRARNRAGTAGMAAEIGGSVLTAGGLAKNGLTLAGRGGTAAMTGLKGLLARAGLMGLEGEVFNKVSSMGYDQEYVPGLGVAAGAGGQVAGEGLSAGLSKILGAFNKAPQQMGVDELKSAAQAAYSKADQAGVIYKPEAVKRISDALKGEFADFGYHPELQSGAKVALGELDRIGGQNVTFKGLDTARKVAGNAYQPMNKSNNALTAKVASAIDDLVQNPQAGDILAGDNAAASAAIKEARDFYGRSAKLEKVQYLLDKAGLNAGSSGSGGNIENATRQQLKTLLTNPKNTRGFKPDEVKALKKAVLGDATQNTFRLAGKLSPQGNGLMLAIQALAAGATGGATVPLAVAGMGAKKVAETMTQANVRKLQSLIASGGVKIPQVKNAAQKAIEGNKDAIIRALMMSGVLAGSQAGQP